MPSVVYQFRTVGAEAVARAYERISEAQKKAMRAKGGVFGGATGRSGSGGGGGGGGMSPEQRAAKEVEKAAEREVKAKARAEAAKEKLADRTEARNNAYKARLRDRHFLNEQRAQEKLEKDGQKLKESSAKKAERDRTRDHASQKRAAAKLNSEMAAIEHREKAKWAKQSEMRMQRIKTAASGIGWGVAGGIASAGAMAGGAGLALAGAALRDRSQARDAAVSMAVGGRIAGDQMASPDALLKNATRAAISVKGTTTSNLIAGMSRYQAMTGDSAGAEANARTIAIGARASGAHETDIAATLATMKEQFKIESPEQQREALAQVLDTGKRGSFELGQAAQFYSEMGSSASRMGLTGMKGLGQLNAMSQVAMSQTGNGAKASTGVQAMLRQFVAKSDDIKRLTGTDIFADKGKTRVNDIEDSIAGVIGGAGGNLGKIQKLMGDEGMQGISGFVKAYNDAQGALDKGATATEKRAAGEQAVRALMQQYATSTATASDMIADAAAAGDTASATLTTAWEKISSGVGDALLPAFSKVAEHADSLAEPLAAMGESVAIVVDRMVGVAKRLGMMKGGDGEEDPANPKQGPKRALFEANEELSGLVAKEKKLGGLSKDDRAKKMKLQSTVMDLKDQLFTADPTLLDKPFDMLTDAGYSKGQGPMRIPDAKSPLEKILAGEGLEDRKLPTSEAGSNYANDYMKAGTLGRVGMSASGFFSRALDGQNPFDTSSEESDIMALAKKTLGKGQSQVMGVQKAEVASGTASNIDTLIAALNQNTAATTANTSKSGSLSTAVIK